VATRSTLSVPGSSTRMLEKAIGSPADEIVIDLEDAVAPAEKDAARANVVAFLADAPRDREIAVRVNAARTPWCHLDIVALAGLATPPDSVVLPKVETAGDLAFIARLVDGAASTRAVVPGVQALIESAAGLTALSSVCAEPAPLTGLILGYADLAASLGRSRSVSPETWGPAQERVIWAARAHALRATDGPYLGTRADDDFQASVRRAAELGFDGKWVIHPSQIEVVNEAFTPAEHDIAWAREVVAALEAAEDRGDGAVELEGQMLDEAIAVSARRILTRAALAEGTR
jgi:citrate lyase subunit beta/citryl-CoA lyase